MLNSLINVSMNGPAELTDEDAITIAQTWQNAKKNRRGVNSRVQKMVNHLNQNKQVDYDDDDLDDFINDYESEKFFI